MEEAALGGRVVLVELLLAGPVIAATGASVRQTATVALVAFVLSIAVGLPGDEFGSLEHVIGVAAVTVGGALAVLVTHLRFARERDSARLRAQYGAARVLAETDTLENAAPRLLEAIGAPLGWELGNLWETSDSGALRCVGS